MPGSQIVRIRTISGAYGHNMLEVVDANDNYYRIKAEELLPLLQAQTFEITMKRKYNHLTITKP